MKRHISEKEFMKKALPAMQDTAPLTVTITIADAWFLVSALQMATRHPALSREMKKKITQGARQFEKAIAQRHPDAEEALVMGWDERFDVEKD